MRKILVVNILSGIIIFAILFIYNQTSIEQALKDYSSVEEVKIQEKNIYVTLKLGENLEQDLTEIMEKIPSDYKIIYLGNSTPELKKFWKEQKNLIIEFLLNKKLTQADKLINSLAPQKIKGQIIISSKGLWVLLKKDKFFIIEFLPIKLLAPS